MITTSELFLLILLAAIVAGICASIGINRRKRHEAQIATEELQRENKEAQQKVKEKRQLIEAEEMQRKAEDERLRHEAEEAQRKTEEELLRREIEEKQSKAEKEGQHLELEKDQRQVEEMHLNNEREGENGKFNDELQYRETKETRRETDEHPRLEAEEKQPQAKEKRRLHKPKEKQHLVQVVRQPEDRGGRPRALSTDSIETINREVKIRQPQSDIVCWQRERRWILAVEVSEDLWGKSNLLIQQNLLPLAEDEHEGNWRLCDINGSILIHSNEDELPQETTILLGEENYLIFKLTGQNMKQGRRVKTISSGSYLVVVPQSWERNVDLSGYPPTSPGPVSIEGFQGHFFDLEKEGIKRIAFITSEDKSMPLGLKSVQFELIGNRLLDATEGIGPLFIKNPPHISALHDGLWTEIETIVIGEEGGKKKRWRKSFNPVPENREQIMPFEATPLKDGWFFLRFYNMNNELTESLDFRFLSTLREIRVPQLEPFPSEGKHKSVQVEFIHESGFTIQPTNDITRKVIIEGNQEKTILTLPPNHVYDETHWRAGTGSKPHIPITVLVERLWWAVDQEGIPPLDWQDELIFLICNDFAPTSTKALWLRFPTLRWTDKVEVGFEKLRGRFYPVKVSQKEISIPLRDFGDCQEMSERDRDQFLNIWIKHNNKDIEGIVVIIPASKGLILSIGRGKKEKAMAIAVLRNGTDTISVNGQSIDDYFRETKDRYKKMLYQLINLPDVIRILEQLEVNIEVSGSNPRTVQQTKASAHAIASALMKYDPQIKQFLKQKGFKGAR